MIFQDLQGEMAACHSCRHALRIAPVVMLHDQDEKRRFEHIFGFPGGFPETKFRAFLDLNPPKLKTGPPLFKLN